MTIPQAGAQPQSVAAALAGVDVLQRLGEKVPLDVHFLDESGKDVLLSQFTGDVPVVLVPVYYRCPMLCTQVLNALVRTLKRIPLEPWRDFHVVVFSIDPRERPSLAAQKKLHYLDRYDQPGASAGWHFLTGEEQEVRRLADAVGFQYTYVAAHDVYNHPAAIILLTKDGTINRYLLGLDFSPRDLRLALVETAEGRIGSLADSILLRCYRYDPASGRYGLAIMTAVRIGGGLTVAGLVGTIVILGRKHRRDSELSRAHDHAV
jgi:protein SCO1/2